MPELAVSRVIARPAPLLWPLLGRFSRLPDWFPGVDSFSCEGDTPGSRRHIRIGPFEVVQLLLEQDDVGFRTVYQVSDGPGISPATGFVVSIYLEAENATHSRAHWQARLTELPSTMPAGSEEVFIARTRKNYEHALDHLEQVLAGSTTV
ncbi:MAG: SRPBCC family protein [Moraxellaceae bacterium]